MNVIIKALSIFLLLMMASSCATTMSTSPKKYNLDNDLEAIDQTSAIKVSSFEQVDNQSIILRANWDEYYLLVLIQPIDRIVSGLSIGLSDKVSSITSGVDSIIVNDTPFTEYYVVDKIYKLKGKEQAEKIKERLHK